MSALAATLPYSPSVVADAARIMLEMSKDRRYRATPIGEEVGRFLRYMRSSDRAERSRDEYEVVLRRFSVDHAHLQLADFAPPVGVERLEEFIDQHWGHLAVGTRRKVTAILASFFKWAYERGKVTANPMPLLTKPRRKITYPRRAHPPAKILHVATSQPLLRDRAAVLLMGKIALRKNEVRLLQLRDFDLDTGLLRIRQKGGDIVFHPIVFPDVLAVIAEHITLDGREPAEFLLYPRWERTVRGELVLQREARERSLSPRGMHEWWERCLRRAEVPHFPMHELRHTAGTEFHRANHDLELTRKFMRHASATTTSEHYMHLDQHELSEGMLKAHARWSS